MKLRTMATLTLALAPALGCGSGSSGGLTTPDPAAQPSSRTNVSTRGYWQLDVGMEWRLYREPDGALTVIRVEEDDAGCKALTFTKTQLDTYHDPGVPTNLTWYVTAGASGLYAGNCVGTFGVDDHPDAIRRHYQTGAILWRTWYTGASPYFLSPWVVSDGDEFRGSQDYHLVYADGRVHDNVGVSWSVRYRLAGDGTLRVQFDEGSYNIYEDWWLREGAGFVAIESWADPGRTRLNTRWAVRGDKS